MIKTNSGQNINFLISSKKCNRCLVLNNIKKYLGKTCWDIQEEGCPKDKFFIVSVEGMDPDWHNKFYRCKGGGCRKCNYEFWSGEGFISQDPDEHPHCYRVGEDWGYEYLTECNCFTMERYNKLLKTECTCKRNKVLPKFALWVTINPPPDYLLDNCLRDMQRCFKSKTIESGWYVIEWRYNETVNCGLHIHCWINASKRHHTIQHLKRFCKSIGIKINKMNPYIKKVPSTDEMSKKDYVSTNVSDEKKKKHKAYDVFKRIRNKIPHFFVKKEINKLNKKLDMKYNIISNMKNVIL